MPGRMFSVRLEVSQLTVIRFGALDCSDSTGNFFSQNLNQQNHSNYGNTP
jgi:hypothetical protein